MTFVRAFRSNHPEVLETEVEWRRQAEVFKKELDACRLLYGTDPVYFETEGLRPAFMIGLKSVPGWDPPPGWRLLRHKERWVPDKRTKEGKKDDVLIKRIRCVSPLLLLKKFIPVEVMIPGHWYSAGCRRIGDMMYVTHGEHFNFDGNMYFHPTPLSEYHRALEEEEATHEHQGG